MPIWKKPATPDELNAISRGTIHEPLGIRFTAVGDDFIEATMTVDARTLQPGGRLHGGASVVLAESLGSFASVLSTEGDPKRCVGVEINANHVKGVSSGSVVTGRVKPVHVGRSLHVWEIRITNEKGELCCISRLTVSVLDSPKSS